MAQRRAIPQYKNARRDDDLIIPADDDKMTLEELQDRIYEDNKRWMIMTIWLLGIILSGIFLTVFLLVGMV